MSEDKSNEETRSKQITLYAKVAQGFFLALFFLGVSIAIGDVAPMLDIPFSPFSMSTMTYGLLGMLGCEFIARRFAS